MTCSLQRTSRDSEKLELSVNNLSIRVSDDTLYKFTRDETQKVCEYVINLCV